MTEISQVVDVVQQAGFAALCLWLLLREMRAHDLTRAQYRADLREIAGMRHGERLFREGPDDPE